MVTARARTGENGKILMCGFDLSNLKPAPIGGDFWRAVALQDEKKKYQEKETSGPLASLLSREPYSHLANIIRIENPNIHIGTTCVYATLGGITRIKINNREWVEKNGLIGFRDLDETSSHSSRA